MVCVCSLFFNAGRSTKYPSCLCWIYHVEIRIINLITNRAFGHHLFQFCLSLWHRVHEVDTRESFERLVGLLHALRHPLYGFGDLANERFRR